MSDKKTAAVEDHNHDRVFVITFLGVLSVLIGIAVTIGVIANVLVEDDAMNPVVLQKTAERLAPVGEVYTDAAQLPVAAAPAKAKTAEEVVQTVCAACHVSGLLDAPKIGDAAEWDKRKKASGGLEGIVTAAIVGKGSMPARGGDSSLSDEQVKAAVELMLK